MIDPSPESDPLARAKAGDTEALGQLFLHFRDRLRKMVRLRLDRRLAGRVDPSDVLQEAYLDLSRRFPEYVANPAVPFYLWLRALTGQRLIDLQRQHLGAQMRDAAREVPLDAGAAAWESTPALAAQLAGHLTSPSQAAIRAEVEARLAAALAAMDPIDREVLVLRLCDELSNDTVAAVLGIQKAGASNRYVRALKRLRESLAGMPGLFDEAR